MIKKMPGVIPAFVLDHMCICLDVGDVVGVRDGASIDPS